MLVCIPLFCRGLDCFLPPLPCVVHNPIPFAGASLKQPVFLLLSARRSIGARSYSSSHMFFLPCIRGSANRSSLLFFFRGDAGLSCAMLSLKLAFMNSPFQVGTLQTDSFSGETFVRGPFTFFLFLFFNQRKPRILPLFFYRHTVQHSRLPPPSLPWPP